MKPAQNVSKRSDEQQPTIPHLDEIVLGECKTLLESLPDGSVDLIVSSPPYNLGKEYEAKRALSIYLDEQKEVLRHCARVLKYTGSIFWQVGAFSDEGSLIPLDIRFFPILEGFGLIPKNRIIWARQHGLHATRKFSCRYETILWFTKSTEHTFNLDPIRVPQKYQNKKHFRGERKGELSCNPDGKNPGDIWLFRNVKHNHEEQTIHPCQFSEDLVARVVLSTTLPGQTVLDPYMGTGTTAVVARDHGRHFLGAELDEKYHKVAMRRLSGIPDKDGMFPNLKTLRNYCEKTGESVSKYRFDVQVGKVATDRSKAKIFSEEHHLEEMEKRLDYEEDAFSARVDIDAYWKARIGIHLTNRQASVLNVIAKAPPSVTLGAIESATGLGAEDVKNALDFLVFQRVVDKGDEHYLLAQHLWEKLE